MLKLKERFVRDKNGKPTAIVLDIRSYRRLRRRLDDLEDALELDKARRSTKSFRPYRAIRTELKKTGRL